MSVQGVPVPGVLQPRRKDAFDGHVAYQLWRMLRDQAVAINRVNPGEVPIPETLPYGRFDKAVADTVSMRLRAHAEAINRLGDRVEVPGVIVPRNGDVFDAVLAADLSERLQQHARAINRLAAAA